MPSEKILTAKQAYVAELKEKIANSVAGVVVDYKGINVADDTKLRKELREAGVEYFVVKNTMLRLAISGTELEGMNDVLEGTTALAIAKEDRIAAARILCKFADASKDKFSVKAGYMDGKLMEKASVEEIAKIIGADSLGYLSVENVHKLANGCRCTFCDGCFTGHYPVPVPEAREKFRFERKLSQT